ncbi:hypothetical protein GCM10010124_38110 [Pilimelia terevasa]|uniref:Uncharacterized protein n=1 Tax=Pilimelia terevasa TaxID=53372 RepID=A0A8J3FK08_9ACTN|nr:hypothetical protein [Pilimelia terevasa]GGK41640.1 hypothetical protein GCM10010124_38110 [Pilimelia terevasa]
MGLENVAVHWPRLGPQYQPVDAARFAAFGALAERTAPASGAAAALAATVAKSATVPATPYTGLVDLLLGLDGVLYATEAAAEDEDPVIDPDGCAWVAGGLERFVDGHAAEGERVDFASVGRVMRAAMSGARLADQQLRWLESRLAALRDDGGAPPAWAFARTELAVLARFYRVCADDGFAVYAHH